MSGGLQIKKQVEELISFLKDPKPDVRLQAAGNVAGFAGTDGGRATLMSVDSKDLVKSLANLVGDLKDVAEQALTALINLSNERRIVSDMLNCTLFDKLMENLKSGEDAGNRRLNLILLSNLTQSAEGSLRMLQANVEKRDLQGLNVLRLVQWFLKSSTNVTPTKVTRVTSQDDGEFEDAVVVDIKNDDTDEWKYVAGILANVTRLKEGRDIVLDMQRGVLKKLLPELHSPSLVRRQGIARVLRNVCFERQKTMWMVTDSDINLLYHIMKRFGCPEPLKENEYDEQYPELYGEAASREPDISVRKTLVDCLVLVASSSRKARDIMRKRKVYPLVREMHSDTEGRLLEKKRQEDRAKFRDSGKQLAKVGDLTEVKDNEPTKFDEAVFKLVDYLMGDEAMEEDENEAQAVDDDAAPGPSQTGLSKSEQQTHFSMNAQDAPKSPSRETLAAAAEKRKLVAQARTQQDAGNSSSSDDDSDDETNVLKFKNLNCADSEDEEDAVELDDAEKLETLATEYKDKGNGMYKVGDYDKAIEWYTKGIDVGASNRIACVCYSNRAASLTLKRRWVEAEADASTCISIAPEFARGYCRLAKVKQKQGYSEDGIGILEQALKKLPGNGLLEDELRKMKRARENAAVKKAARQKAAKERKEKDAAYDKAKAENEANSKPETKQFERTPDGLINLRVDSAKMSKEEMVQLQTLAGQYEDVKRQHREANLLMGRFEYEKKKDVLTLQEVASLESGRNTYRSIGKSYVMQPLEKIQDQIKSDITNRESEGTTLQSRQGYLQKRLISLEGELKDLVGGINSR